MAPKVTPPARPSARSGLVASASAQPGLTHQHGASSGRKQFCSEGLGHQSERLRWPWLPGGPQWSQPRSMSEGGWPEAASSGVALPSFSSELSVTLPRALSKVGAHHMDREAWRGAQPQTRPDRVVSPAEAQSCLVGNSQWRLVGRESLHAARPTLWGPFRLNTQ